MTERNDYRELSNPAVLAVTPLVSVHMLAYRHADFIAAAIQGVVDQQTDFPIELIIAEDCSPDSTLKIALNYQREYPSLIRIITGDDNVGMHANAERCLTASRGDYIAICEGDDYWNDPTKLARQISLFRSTPQCALVFHSAAYVDCATGKQTRTSRQSLFSRVLSTEEVVLGDGGLMPTASILIRKQLALELPTWYYQAPVGDYPLALHAALSGKIAYLDRVMSVYRTNVPHSWTHRYVPDIGSRVEYARRIEAMFSGFSADTDGRFDKATKEMISKYYSDPLVRLPASLEERRRFFDEVAGKLRGSDRWLAWLAVRFDLQLPRLKDLLRKSRSLRRLIKAHVFAERITASPHSGGAGVEERHAE
jgi:glycosyltransferase involved in cell wall biosynthesis